MNYTKHQLKRIRDLNDEYFEVVFNKRSLKFSPGDAITLYNGPDHPVFIASGISEPWIRIILKRDLFPDFDYNAVSIRLNKEIQSILPNLMNETAPNFILTAEGIGAFFSYTSTYPRVKCKVCYLGSDKVQENWVKSYHKAVTLPRRMGKLSDLYAIGDREVLERKAKKVLGKCKQVYLV